MTRPPAPDIVLLTTEWQPRTLIRAQLIEDGFEVAATDSWPMMRPYFGPGPIPQLAIVDLLGLPDPLSVLDDLRGLTKPERVLVLTSLGTIPKADLELMGFNLLARPLAIEEITRTAANLSRSPANSFVLRTRRNGISSFQSFRLWKVFPFED